MEYTKRARPARSQALTVSLAVIIFASAVTAIATPAEALSASCGVGIDTPIYHENDPTEYRAMGSCSSIGGDTKVRIKMNRNNAIDALGSWFTVTYTTKYSPWTWCYWGCYADHDVAAR